jgi:terephthalate 1,2-dioxygenase reductase component
MSTAAPPVSLPVLLADSDVVIACRPGESILEAAYAQGVALPYACRRGICGLCAADLLDGVVMPIDALPMTNAQCKAGQVLLCRCTPASAPVTLRPSQWELRAVRRRLPPL